MENNSGNGKENRNVIIITYFVGLLFLGLVFYFGFFVQVTSEEVINNPYNARLDQRAERILRGKILSNDTTVLAESQRQEDQTEVRVYPYGPMFAHVIGYSGLSQGKTGLEALGNFYLLSSHMNLVERVVNELADEKNIGDNIVTTLDYQLQSVAYEALEGRRGAIVAMEPNTGKVLAMVSKPDYDPNTLEANWEWLLSADNDQAQLLNRSTQGLYPPGSTFKVITALAYIREHPDDYQNYHFDCTGRYQIGDYTIKCFHETAHGSQNFTQAFANSCNGAFASLGLELNLITLQQNTQELLFNQDLPLPVAYRKSSFTMNEEADIWEILQTSIGQGNTQMTPMHSVMLSAAIANGGTLMTPYFIDHVENAGGEEVKKFMPEAYGSLLSATESDALTELMAEVVQSGTGSALKSAEYRVAGKTGSAEFETGKETHSWFMGFAPVDNPQIAICVLVEESGSGGSVAAPIAKKAMDSYLLR